MKRYSVLTFIFNNYDVVHEIEHKDPDAEYILVTDDPNTHSDSWTVVYDKDIANMSPFDKSFSVRYNCFKYCSTDICVRIDGSIRVKLSLKPLIDIFEEGKYDACLLPHPFRYNIIDEYNAWIRIRHYNKAQAERCIRAIREMGYDFDYKGLFQTCFAIQRRCKLTKEIDKKMFAMLKQFGTNGRIERLDQTFFSVLINTDYSHLKILPISSQFLSSAYFQLYQHGGKIPNFFNMPDIRKDDIRYMFNKEVKCLYLPTPLDPDIIAHREYELISELQKAQLELPSYRIIKVAKILRKMKKKLFFWK